MRLTSGGFSTVSTASWFKLEHYVLLRYKKVALNMLPGQPSCNLSKIIANLLANFLEGVSDLISNSWMIFIGMVGDFINHLTN
jgi:hypothetical protein